MNQGVFRPRGGHGARGRAMTRGGAALIARAVLARGVLFAGLWWVLAEGRADSWGVGGVTVGLALAASLLLLAATEGRYSPLGFAAFVGFFLVQSVKVASKVAGMALRPRLDLAPAMVDWATCRPWAPHCGRSRLPRCWRWRLGAQTGVCP